MDIKPGMFFLSPNVLELQYHELLSDPVTDKDFF